jgi:Cu(I)/Ag(I) efflux system membrane protein CusA/SilA
MLQRVIDWSIRHRILVVFLTAVAILVGIVALTSTPVDAIPDLSDVQVIVYTEHPGQ